MLLGLPNSPLASRKACLQAGVEHEFVVEM